MDIILAAVDDTCQPGSSHDIIDILYENMTFVINPEAFYIPAQYRGYEKPVYTLFPYHGHFAVYGRGTRRRGSSEPRFPSGEASFYLGSPLDGLMVQECAAGGKRFPAN